MKHIERDGLLLMKDKFILQGENLTYSYDKEQNTFQNLCFEMYAGDIFVILGPNGAGKSTLLNCLSNVITPSQGIVYLKNKPIQEYSIREVATIMGYVPQISSQTFSLTVRDYVVMGRAPYMGVLNTPGDAEYQKADEAMAKMNIQHLADKIYDQMSGGERQQAQIARVLAQEPEIILMDEPTNHLDYGNQLKIIEIIAQLSHDGMAVIMTSHIPDHAILLNGLVGLLDQQGHFVSGACNNVISETVLSELYGTEIHLVHIDVLNRTVCVAGKPLSS